MGKAAAAYFVTLYHHLGGAFLFFFQEQSGDHLVKATQVRSSAIYSREKKIIGDNSGGVPNGCSLYPSPPHKIDQPRSSSAGV